jgi:CTP synthase
LAEVYGTTEISERHRRGYEVNTHYAKDLGQARYDRAPGWSPDGRLPEIMEISHHPWFIGVQFHPELKSWAAGAASAVHQLHRGGSAKELVGASSCR